MKNKLVAFLLCLVVSLGMWLYVVNYISPESEAMFYNIPVVFEGETVLTTERNLMITDISSTTVNMKISGNRSDLNKVNSNNIVVKIDLTKVYDPGETQLTYSYSFPGDIPSGALTVENKFPSAITITTDSKRTREIPVKVVYTGSAPEGFITDTENAVLDYNFVNVTGPSKVVELIDHARIDVDLTGRVESINESFVYTLCDAAGTPVNAEQVVTDVAEVRLNLVIQRFQVVMLKLNLTYGGGTNENNVIVDLAPQSIRVSGSEKMLESLTELVVGSVDLSTIEADTTLTFPINLPEGVTNLSGVTEVTATIKFDNLSIKKFQVSNIQVVNVPEGMEYDLMSQVLEVTLRGNKVLVGMLDPNDISAVVDLSGKEPGTFTVKASIIITNSSYSAVGEMGSHSVSVTLTAAAAEAEVVAEDQVEE